MNLPWESSIVGYWESIRPYSCISCEMNQVMYYAILHKSKKKKQKWAEMTIKDSKK